MAEKVERLQISIVGLGLIGASAGLALHRHADRVFVVGHDPDSALAANAKKIGAVDRTEWNLVAAVAKADRVLLALPVEQVCDTLKAIAADLKPGCVIVDTADLKAPVMASAAEYLGPDAHFIGGHPIVIAESFDPSAARVDLFDQKTFCLTPDVSSNAAAVQLAADLAEALGAKPFFLDSAEHDGMAAAVEHLPRLLAGALLSVTTGSSSWKDMRKLAGSQFYAGTSLVGTGKHAAALAANQEQTGYWLDQLIEKLREWQKALAEGDDATVSKDLDASLAAGQKWLLDYHRGVWDEDSSALKLPTSGGMFRDLLGFGKWRTPPDKSKSK